MEVGCLRHQGASTVGSQLLDEDCSHGWQIQAKQPWALMHKRNRHQWHCWNSGKREGNGVGGELPGWWAATTKSAENTSCPYAMLRSTSTYRGMQVLFFVNSVELHLTAFMKNSGRSWKKWWKGMEFQKLKRVWTLRHHQLNPFAWPSLSWLFLIYWQQ